MHILIYTNGIYYSVNWLLVKPKHSGLLGNVLFFLISLTYQIIIGQNIKGDIKPSINQLVSSIMVAKPTFECDPAGSSCASEHNIVHSSSRLFFLMSIA